MRATKIDDLIKVGERETTIREEFRKPQGRKPPIRATLCDNQPGATFPRPPYYEVGLGSDGGTIQTFYISPEEGAELKRLYPNWV